MLVDGRQRSLTKNSGSTTQYHHISTPTTKHRISTALLEPPYDNIIVNNEDKENIIMMVLEDNDAMASSEATFDQQLKFDKYYRYRSTDVDYERNDLASCTVYPTAKRDATTFCPLCDILINEQLCYYDRLKKFHKCHLNALTSNGWNVNRTITETISVQQQRFGEIPVSRANSVCRAEYLHKHYDKKMNESDDKRTLVSIKRCEEENATSKRKYRIRSNEIDRSTVSGFMSTANSILRSELPVVSDVIREKRTVIEQVDWTKDSRKKLVLKFSSGRRNILDDVLSQTELWFLNDILNRLKNAENQRNFRLIQTRPAVGLLRRRKDYPLNYFNTLLKLLGIPMEPTEEELKQIKRKRTVSSARSNRTVRLRTLLLGIFFGFYLQNNLDDAMKNKTVACVPGTEKSFQLDVRESTVSRLIREFLNEFFVSSNGDDQIGVNKEDDGVKIAEIEDTVDHQRVERTIYYSTRIDRQVDDCCGNERVVKEDVLWSQFADNMNRTIADFDETIDTLEMLIEKLCRVQSFDKANGDADGECTPDRVGTGCGLSGDSGESPQQGTIFYEYNLWNSSIFENGSAVDEKKYSSNADDNDDNRTDTNYVIASENISFEPYRMWSSPYIGSDILQSARRTRNNGENRNESGRTDDTEDDYNLSGKYDLWTCPDLSKCLWNSNNGANNDENIVASAAEQVAASFPVSFNTIADLTLPERAIEAVTGAGEAQFNVSLKNFTAGDASTPRFSYFSDQSSSEPCNSMGSSMYSLFGESIDYATTNNISSPHYDPHIDINRKLNPLMRTFAYEEAGFTGTCRFNLSSGCSSYNNNSAWPDNDSRNDTVLEDELRYRIVDGYSLPLLADLSSSERNNGSIAEDGYRLFRNNRLRSSNTVSYGNPLSSSLNEYSLFPPADESNGNCNNLGPENLYSYLQSIKNRSDYRMEELRLDQEVEDSLASVVKSGRFDERYLFKPIDPPTSVPLDDPPVFIRSASGALYNEHGDQLMEFIHPNAGPDDVLFRPKFRVLKQDKATQTSADLSPSSLSPSSVILSSIYRNILDLATLDGLRDIVDFSSPATTPLPLPPSSSGSYCFNECNTIMDFHQPSHLRQQQRQQIDCNFSADNVNSNNIVAV